MSECHCYPSSLALCLCRFSSSLFKLQLSFLVAKFISTSRAVRAVFCAVYLADKMRNRGEILPVSPRVSHILVFSLVLEET